MSKKKKERKHNYVIGYPGAGQCVYGKHDDDGHYHSWVDLLTPHQAKAVQKKMPNRSARIYRLVDVTDEVLGEAKP